MKFTERALILAPHTDDAELGCGGTISRLIDEGVKITVAAFSTACESLLPGTDPDALSKEFHEAMSVLGVPERDRLIFDYPVRKFPALRQDILEDLIRIRGRLNPDLVLVPAGSDVHQDHHVLFEEGVRAFKHVSVWGYEMPWNQIAFSAQGFVRLTAAHLGRKWDAMRCYRSQIEKNVCYFTQDFIESLARVRGAQIRAEYAEAYEVIRFRY